MKHLLRRAMRASLITFATRLVLKSCEIASRLGSVLRTAAIFRHSRQLPFCHWSVNVKFPENIELGQDVVIGPRTTLGAKGGIMLGDYVRISEGVLIETAGLDFKGDPPYSHISRPIRIERGAWLGARAIVLGGVTIGEGSIVGAGAIVTKTVPAHTVVAGTGLRTWPKAVGRTQRSQP